MRGPFTWDQTTARYRDAAGRFVSRAEVRQALDMALDAEQRRMLLLAEELRAGRIGLAAFRTEMQTALKELHLYSAAAARGGWGQMTQADFGRVGRELRDAYGFLDRMVRQLHRGEQPMDGRFIQRVKLYAQSGRAMYHATERVVMLEAGKTEERNHLGAAEHCEECIAETTRGWVPIGDLVPVGERTCLGFCKCMIEYR